VIDVLRSFTTAAYAFAAGASTIYPVETIAGAFRLLRRCRTLLTTGAVGGGDPIPGFDFGNSPLALQGANLAGRPLIQTTAAGVRGLSRFRSCARAVRRQPGPRPGHGESAAGLAAGGSVLRDHRRMGRSRRRRGYRLRGLSGSAAARRGSRSGSVRQTRAQLRFRPPLSGRTATPTCRPAISASARTPIASTSLCCGLAGHGRPAQAGPLSTASSRSRALTQPTASWGMLAPSPPPR
jgi:hypothetical protein